MTSSIEWKRMTANDLRHCDQRAKEIILQAMKYGAEARLSSKGHVIVRGPNGATMSVARNMNSSNRARQNTEAEFARVFGDIEVPDNKAKASNGSAPALLPPERATEPTLECPAKGCEAVFVTEGARYSHIEKEHHKCYECGAVLASSRGLRGHRVMAHSENPPWKVSADARRGAGTRRKSPEKVPAKAKRAPAAKKKAPTGAEQVLASIRELVGTDPRVAELEAECAALRAERDALKATLAKIKEDLA